MNPVLIDVLLKVRSLFETAVTVKRGIVALLDREITQKQKYGSRNLHGDGGPQQENTSIQSDLRFATALWNGAADAHYPPSHIAKCDKKQIIAACDLRYDWSRIRIATCDNPSLLLTGYKKRRPPWLCGLLPAGIDRAGIL